MESLESLTLSPFCYDVLNMQESIVSPKLGDYSLLPYAGKSRNIFKIALSDLDAFDALKIFRSRTVFLADKHTPDGARIYHRLFNHLTKQIDDILPGSAPAFV